jgi:hypothetical protein
LRVKTLEQDIWRLKEKRTLTTMEKDTIHHRRHQFPWCQTGQILTCTIKAFTSRTLHTT